MKKVLIICGLMLLMPALFFGYVEWRAAKNHQQQIRYMRQAAAIYQKLERDHPFDTESDAPVDVLRFEKWIKIAGEIRDQNDRVNVALGSMDAKEERWERYLGSHVSHYLYLKQFDYSILEFVPMAEIFERHQMSPTEYNWIRDQFLGALGSNAILKVPDLARFSGREYETEIDYGKQPLQSYLEADSDIVDFDATATISLTQLLAEKHQELVAEITEEQRQHMIRLIELYQAEIEDLLDFLTTDDAIRKTDFLEVLTFADSIP